MTEAKETPWADGERAELVSKLTAAIDADPASEEFKTLFLKVLEAHSEREASLLKALEEAKAALADCEEYFDGKADADQPAGCDHPIPNEEMRLLATVREAISSIQKDQK